MYRRSLPLFLSASLSWASPQSPSSSVERREIGQLLAAGKTQEAEKRLRDALAQSPNSAELYAQLGILYHQLKRHAEAIEHLGRAVQLDEGNAEYAMGLADALLTARRFGVAAEFLTAVKPRFQKLPAYQYNLGLAYYGARNFAASLEHFRQALKLAPDLDLARYFEGNCLAATGDLEGAQQSYRAALARNPEQPDYLFALAKILSLSGPEHDPETIALLEKALALKPSHTPSQLYLALAFERSGRLGEARDLLEGVARDFPDQIEPHAALARIYYRLKQRDKGDEASRIVRKLREAQSPRQR
jgi:cytochrome c-type biogenesis protein CcmH/NrfG